MPLNVRFLEYQKLGLQLIADRLNMLPQYSGKVQYAWEQAKIIIEDLSDPPPTIKEEKEAGRGPVSLIRRKAILSPTHRGRTQYYRIPLYAHAIASFNSLATNHPIPLKVIGYKPSKRPLEIGLKYPKGVEIRSVHDFKDEIQSALWYLWECVFPNEGWQRLKRCQTCEKWFVDMSQDRRGLRCSPKCSSKWWTRPRRGISTRFKKSRKTSTLGKT